MVTEGLTKMSRSRRKTPISGWTCSQSNKKFKQYEHRRERRKARVGLLIDPEEDYKLPHPKEYGNEWSSPRDGKMWFGDCKYGSPQYYWYRSYQTEEEYIEDQKEEYQRLMRK